MITPGVENHPHYGLYYCKILYTKPIKLFHKCPIAIFKIKGGKSVYCTKKSFYWFIINDERFVSFSRGETEKKGRKNI